MGALGGTASRWREARELLWCRARDGWRVAGTLGGYQARSRSVKALGSPDFVVALIEDIVTVGGSLWVVSRFWFLGLPGPLDAQFRSAIILAGPQLVRCLWALPEHYDAVVIGAGQAGTPLCQALAKAGMRTAVVESVHVGGTCVNEGCTPTKTMVASGRVAYLARRSADYGVNTTSLRNRDGAGEETQARHREPIPHGRRKEHRKHPETGSDLRAGFFHRNKIPSGEFTQGGRARRCRAERIFINAGCRPSVPDLEGLDEVPYLNSTSVMELAKVPKHLLVLGGGYIGLEFGQLFRRLGSRVTIVQKGPRLFGREDQDVAEG